MSTKANTDSVEGEVVAEYTRRFAGLTEFYEGKI